MAAGCVVTAKHQSGSGQQTLLSQKNATPNSTVFDSHSPPAWGMPPRPPSVGVGFGIPRPPLWVWGLGSENNCCLHYSCIMSKLFSLSLSVDVALIHIEQMSKSL